MENEHFASNLVDGVGLIIHTALMSNTATMSTVASEEPRLRFSRRNLEYHAHLFIKAKADYDRLTSSDLHKWLRKAATHPEMRDDPFTIEVAKRYQRDYDAEMNDIQQRLLNAILHASRATKLRFVSLDQYDIIGFEGVEAPRYGRSFSQPAAWVIADALKISGGCGNSGQAQVNLRMLSSDRCGVYDLRTKPFTRIGDPLSFQNMSLIVIDEPFDTQDIKTHLLRCAGVKISRQFSSRRQTEDVG